MTNLDHNRPILKLIDAMKRERQHIASSKVPGSGKLKNVIKRATPLSVKRDREIVHESAVEVLRHFGLHHDLRVFVRFLDAVADPRYCNGLTRWFCSHAPVTVDESGNFHAGKGFAVSIAAARLDPFWNHYAKPAPKAIDPVAELERVAQKLAKSGAATPKLLLDLRALIEKHRTGSPPVE